MEAFKRIGCRGGLGAAGIVNGLAGQYTVFDNLLKCEYLVHIHFAAKIAQEVRGRTGRDDHGHIIFFDEIEQHAVKAHIERLVPLQVFFNIGPVYVLAHSFDAGDVIERTQAAERVVRDPALPAAFADLQAVVDKLILDGVLFVVQEGHPGKQGRALSDGVVPVDQCIWHTIFPPVIILSYSGLGYKSPMSFQ